MADGGCWHLYPAGAQTESWKARCEAQTALTRHFKPTMQDNIITRLKKLFFDSGLVHIVSDIMSHIRRIIVRSPWVVLSNALEGVSIRFAYLLNSRARLFKRISCRTEDLKQMSRNYFFQGSQGTSALSSVLAQ